MFMRAVLTAVLVVECRPVVNCGRIIVNPAPVLTPEVVSALPQTVSGPIFFPVPPRAVTQPIFQQQMFVPQQQVPQTQPGTPTGGPLPCPFDQETLVHATHNGREYHFSWCRRPGMTFGFQDAQDYCEALPRSGHPVGFRAISIETQDEDSFISNRIDHYLVPYYWTSGRRVSVNSWMWQSAIGSQYTNWSHTGGRGLPQPDNNFGDENCLAVLNNFYHDGILWHDVPCDLDKYVICERPQRYGIA